MPKATYHIDDLCRPPPLLERAFLLYSQNSGLLAQCTIEKLWIIFVLYKSCIQLRYLYHNAYILIFAQFMNVFNLHLNMRSFLQFCTSLCPSLFAFESWLTSKGQNAFRQTMLWMRSLSSSSRPKSNLKAIFNTVCRQSGFFLGKGCCCSCNTYATGGIASSLNWPKVIGYVA